MSLDDERRFIPARAGNIRRSRGKRVTTSVHPRAGGEHILHSVGDSGFVGSSPRGRGTYSPSEDENYGFRFIPARAGNMRTST